LEGRTSEENPTRKKREEAIRRGEKRAIVGGKAGRSSQREQLATRQLQRGTSKGNGDRRKPNAAVVHLEEEIVRGPQELKKGCLLRKRAPVEGEKASDKKVFALKEKTMGRNDDCYAEGRGDAGRKMLEARNKEPRRV